MPFSYPYFKEEVKQHLLDVLDKDSSILDVGAGAGKYGKLLRSHFTIDAIEIFAPYIEQFGLRSIYRNVYTEDIRSFDVKDYDYFIIGDVLEHLSQSDALAFLERIKTKKYLIAVPYMYEQGESFNNIHETHLQPTLTEKGMKQIYSVNKLFGNRRYGYFINY